MQSMDSRSFLKGVGMGMAIGASMGMLMAPKKKGDNVIGPGAQGRRGAGGQYQRRHAVNPDRPAGQQSSTPLSPAPAW